MRIFRRIEELEKQNVALANSVLELQERIKALEDKVPGYEEAVSRGVDSIWNKAMQSIIDYDPFAKTEAGGEL